MINRLMEIVRKGKTELVGLDVGSAAVKLVRLQPDGRGFAVSGFSVVEIRENANGNEAESGAVEAVKRALREAGVTTNEVYMVISGEEVITKRLILPSMPVRELPEALQWEAGNYLPSESENYYRDFRVLSEFTDNEGVKQKSILFAAAGKKFVEEKIAIVNKAGLMPAGAGIIAEGMGNLIRHAKKKFGDEPVVIVDIGAGRTSVIISRGATLQFNREFSLGSRDFTGAMTGIITSEAGKIELDGARAGEIKLEYGIPDVNDTRLTEEGISLAQILPMIRPVTERLASELRRSLDYYATEVSGGGRVSGLVLSGGGSKCRNLDSFLKDALKLEVRKIDLPEDVRVQEADRERFKAYLPEMAPAMGITLGAGRGINLLPPELRWKKLERIEKTSLRLAALFVGLSLLLVFGGMQLKIRSLRNQLGQMRSGYEQLHKAEVLLSGFDEVRNYVKEITGSRIMVDGLLKDLSHIMPPLIELDKIAFNREERAIKLGGIVFAGRETTETTLARFMGLLEESPFYRKVELLSTRKNEEQPESTASFELAAELIIE